MLKIQNAAHSEEHKVYQRAKSEMEFGKSYVD
jgi:hypothetical protein